MSTKPGSPCKLEKDKLISAQKGFVETFNWMCDFSSNIDGEASSENDSEGGVYVDKTMSDHPKIKLAGVNEIEVITDVSFSTDTDGKVTATFSKKKVRILGDPEDADPIEEEFQTGSSSGEVDIRSGADSNVVVAPHTAADGHTYYTIDVYYA